MMTARQYRDILKQYLKSFDRKRAAETCDLLVEQLYATEQVFEVKDMESIMQQLRDKRLFHLMQKVGDVLIQTGRQSHKIKRLYAQSLIDQNNLTASIYILKELLNEMENTPLGDTAAKEEKNETSGLLGRVYKQLYVNCNCPGTRAGVGFLKESIKYYLDVYTSDPVTKTWHGINAVALLKRARQDDIQLHGVPDYGELASKILLTIKDKHENHQANAWDFATAAEACIAMEQPREALEWMGGYARMPYCDAFELGSTLRQLEEVWRLDLNSEAGRLLLPLLRAQLLHREGGNVSISAEEMGQQLIDETEVSLEYRALIQKEEQGQTEDQYSSLEKTFGDDSFKTYKWYMKGVSRCSSVARIGRDSSKGEGTGFLLRGHALHKSFGEELLLLTNSHVISDDPSEKALGPDEVVIIFETLDRDQEFRPLEILWSSPSTELDATLLRFSGPDLKRLAELISDKSDFDYPVSKYLPLVETPPSQRIYIIGHPYGGTLQLSLQDNILLDHEDPKIHYRTPTEGGSSGSPVFNQQWELIGIHHAGSKNMPCLNRRPGSYEANEGIWIQALKRRLEEEFL